jgi:hypothetical protein
MIDAESRYNAMLEEISSLQDGFVDGSVKIKEFREGIEEINKECKSKNYPFSINKEFTKLKKAKLHQKLMEIFPGDFFEFSDNVTKYKFETSTMNDYMGGWNYGI